VKCEGEELNTDEELQVLGDSKRGASERGAWSVKT
jgi:hypothetical protein